MPRLLPTSPPFPPRLLSQLSNISTIGKVLGGLGTDGLMRNILLVASIEKLPRGFNEDMYLIMQDKERLEALGKLCGEEPACRVRMASSLHRLCELELSTYSTTLQHDMELITSSDGASTTYRKDPRETTALQYRIEKKKAKTTSFAFSSLPL